MWPWQSQKDYRVEGGTHSHRESGGRGRAFWALENTGWGNHRWFLATVGRRLGLVSW